jgi:hypothetical protein
MMMQPTPTGTTFRVRAAVTRSFDALRPLFR